MFPEEVLHSSLHDPWSKKALGLGLVLMATHSRTHSARDQCQSFRCHQPINILTSCISHPRIWWYSCRSSHNVHERAEWSQPLLNMQHQRYLCLLHLLCPLQCNKIFLELVLSNTMHLIFLFALMKNFWNKHMPSKWPQIIPHMNGLLNNMASKGYLS